MPRLRGQLLPRLRGTRAAGLAARRLVFGLLGPAAGDVHRGSQESRGIIRSLLEMRTNLLRCFFGLFHVKNGIKPAVRAHHARAPSELNKSFGDKEQTHEKENSARVELLKDERGEDGSPEKSREHVAGTDSFFLVHAARDAAKSAKCLDSFRKDIEPLKTFRHFNHGNLFLVQSKRPGPCESKTFCYAQGMNTSKHVFTLLIALTVSLSILPWSKVQAARGDDYEEMSYDDLVNELSQKRDQSSKAQKRGPARSHLGLGMTNSWNQIQTAGKSYTANITGYEISTGMDLSQENVRGELAFRFMPETQNGSESASLNEINAGLGFRRDLNARWRTKFMGGLGFRFLNFSDSSNGANVQETSSMLLGSAGLESKLSANVALGGDLSIRTPFFGSSTPDKNSISMGLKLDTSFE